MFPSSSRAEEMHEGRSGVIELNGRVGMKTRSANKWGWVNDTIFPGSIYSSREGRRTERGLFV